MLQRDVGVDEVEGLVGEETQIAGGVDVEVAALDGARVAPRLLDHHGGERGRIPLDLLVHIDFLDKPPRGDDIFWIDHRFYLDTVGSDILTHDQPFLFPVWVVDFDFQHKPVDLGLR